MPSSLNNHNKSLSDEWTCAEVQASGFHFRVKELSGFSWWVPGFVHQIFLIVLKLYSISFEYVFNLASRQMAIVKSLYLTWHFPFHIPLLFIAQQSNLSPVCMKGGTFVCSCRSQIFEHLKTHVEHVFVKMLRRPITRYSGQMLFSSLLLFFKSEKLREKLDPCL